MSTITLKAIVPEKWEFTIKSISPMIQHAWSKKGLRQMRMTPIERKKQPKVARDPESESESARYRTSDGRSGIHIFAFKSSLISAAHKDFGLEKTLLRKALFVPCSDPGNIIPIMADEPVIREDIVKVGMSQTDLRYRPEFAQWSAVIEIQIDSELLTISDVIKLTDRAGFGVGIGEWRPEKGGEYGRFCVDQTKPVVQLAGDGEISAQEQRDGD